jgi:hypothetical protein
MAVSLINKTQLASNVSDLVSGYGQNFFYSISNPSGFSSYSQLTGVSGYISTNLATTGSTLAANLATTGSTLAANLATTGSTLVGAISSLSGTLTGNYVPNDSKLITTDGLGNLSIVGSLNVVATGINPVVDVSLSAFRGTSQKSVYTQIRNYYAGVTSSSDLSIYNDDGVNFVDLGIASTKYNGAQYSPPFTAVNSGDSYLYATSNNLVIGATGANSNINFFTSGSNASSICVSITSGGNLKSRTITLTGSQPSSPLPGTMYYDSTSGHFYGWNGTVWKQLDN